MFLISFIKSINIKLMNDDDEWDVDANMAADTN